MAEKEPKLYQRDGIFWVEFYVPDIIGERRVRHSLKTRNKKEAERKFIEIAYGKLKGTLQKPSVTLLLELFEEHKAHLRRELSKKSAGNDCYYLDEFAKWLPKKVTRLEQITTIKTFRFGGWDHTEVLANWRA